MKIIWKCKGGGNFIFIFYNLKPFTMKMSFFYLVTFILFFSCNAKSQTDTIETQVGNLVNNEPVFSVNKQALIRIFNTNLLALSGINGNFTDANIIKDDNGSYFLVFTGESYKSTFSVFVENNNKLIARAGTTCTTTDCATQPLGCIPSAPYYTSCTPCANKGKCTKTVSQNSLLEEH